MRSPTFTALVFVFLNRQVLAGSDVRTAAAIDLALARQYFDESRTICERDGGRLWGKSLCGPMLFVDRATFAVVANQSDREGRLVEQDPVFVGMMPEKESIANTAMQWAGEKWTMIIWPLPNDENDRAALMAHELWHRIQSNLGLPASNPANSHLDSADGRIWLRLEWRALAAALGNTGEPRRVAVADALMFRAFRRSLFPEAAREENGLELNEGLAEYTGVKLSGRSPAATDELVRTKLSESEQSSSFMRSFAYTSGPAWCLLLDDSSATWKKGLKPDDDLAATLQRALSITLPPKLSDEAQARGRHYDGETLVVAERGREAKRRERQAELRAKLLDGPVLRLPFLKMNIEFDPNNIESLDGVGSVYPTLRITDQWGILTVSSGALIGKDWAWVQVPVARNSTGPPLRGDGWTLQLNDGWTPKPGTRLGDWVLARR
jgi:hypothetical protein